MLFKRTIKIPQQGENLRLYMTNKFNLDTINVNIISSAQKYNNCKNCGPCGLNGMRNVQDAKI